LPVSTVRKRVQVFPRILRFIAVFGATSALAALAVTAGPCLAAAPAAGARADVFNGRIAFSSFRTDPAERLGDIFSMNPDGTDQRRLTDYPLDDAQSDWSPDGRDIAYRIRKPETPTTNFEVARMTASGEDHRRLTFTPAGQASSQPSWFPDKSAILFRWSAPRVSNIWRMGPLGESPVLRYDPTPGHQWYPSPSPDMSKVLFATTTSPTGDTDRAIQTLNVDGTGLTTLFDVVGAFDSAPAWSRDGKRIAFESNANLDGANPGDDEEIWVMDADGANPIQLTHNAVRDEGPAWSPDGTMLAYSSGLDNDHLDINVMTAAGVHLDTLTDHPGHDESPDWQPIPAPPADRRCGDLVEAGPGAHDVRAAGDGLSCDKALDLAARWSPGVKPGNRSAKLEGFDADATDFGGTWRVVLAHRGNHGDDTGNDKLVAFLYQP
jgi:Tol biopolymer transport system component